MGWRRLFGIIAVLGLLGSSPAWATTHALIMSIGDYQNGVTPLGGVHYDMESARQIAHTLGVTDENITQLHDGELTLDGMRNALDSFIKRVAPNDEVFVYYSGHGGREYVRDPVERCAESLVTVNGQGFTDAEFSARLEQLAAKARRVIVFLDACHSGGVTTRAIHGAAKKARFAPKYWAKGRADACGHPSNIIVQSLTQKTRSLGDGAQNYVYISAARDDEVSLDEPGKGGLATQAWIQCLSGGAADLDGSGAITADEVRVCAQQRIDNAVAGAEEVKPHHIKIIGNANAVMALNTSNEAKAGAAKSASPYNTLLDIYHGRDDRRLVTLKAEKTKLRIGQDKVEFTLSSTHSGYVYLLMVGSDGKTFDLLFPNALDKGYHLEASETLRLPAPNWQIQVQGPKGKDHLLAIVSDAPRDFSGLGAKPAGPFSVLDANVSAARDIQLVTSGQKGAKECDKSHAADGRCSDAYGAAILSVEEVE